MTDLGGDPRPGYDKGPHAAVAVSEIHHPARDHDVIGVTIGVVFCNFKWPLGVGNIDDPETAATIGNERKLAGDRDAFSVSGCIPPAYFTGTRGIRNIDDLETGPVVRHVGVRALDTNIRGPICLEMSNLLDMGPIRYVENPETGVAICDVRYRPYNVDPSDMTRRIDVPGHGWLQRLRQVDDLEALVAVG